MWGFPSVLYGALNGTIEKYNLFHTKTSKRKHKKVMALGREEGEKSRNIKMKMAGSLTS